MQVDVCLPEKEDNYAPKSTYCQRSSRLSLLCLSNCYDDDRIRTGTTGLGNDAGGSRSSYAGVGSRDNHQERAVSG